MARDLRIRAAAASDLDAVERLEASVFMSDRLSRRSLRYYIDSPTASFLVIEASGHVAGDAIVAFRRGSSLARIYSIAIHADFAGRGLGRRLLLACEQTAQRRGATAIRLEVRSDNPAAIHLYERGGYVRFGTYPDYYEDGMAALRFGKTIPNDAFGDATPGQRPSSS